MCSSSPFFQVKEEPKPDVEESESDEDEDLLRARAATTAEAPNSGGKGKGKGHKNNKKDKRKIAEAKERGRAAKCHKARRPESSAEANAGQPVPTATFSGSTGPGDAKQGPSQPGSPRASTALVSQSGRGTTTSTTSFSKLAVQCEKYLHSLDIPKLLEGEPSGTWFNNALRAVTAIDKLRPGCAEAVQLTAAMNMAEAARKLSPGEIGKLKKEEVAKFAEDGFRCSSLSQVLWRGVNQITSTSLCSTSVDQEEKRNGAETQQKKRFWKLQHCVLTHLLLRCLSHSQNQ